MADDPDLLNRVTITFEAMPDPDGVRPAIRLRHLLKRAKRDWYLKCVGMAPAPAPGDDQSEVARLRQLVAGMADRIADQAEALARAAERNGTQPRQEDTTP